MLPRWKFSWSRRNCRALRFGYPRDHETVQHGHEVSRIRIESDGGGWRACLRTESPAAGLIHAVRNRAGADRDDVGVGRHRVVGGPLEHHEALGEPNGAQELVMAARSEASSVRV